MVINKKHLNEFKVGDTVYYKGRKDYKFYTYKLGAPNEPPKEGVVIYNEEPDQMQTVAITEVANSRGYHILVGYFQSFTLDNGNEIEPFRCFKSIEEYENAYRPIETKVIENDWDNIVFPKISNKFATDDIMSVEPLIQRSDEIFLNE